MEDVDHVISILKETQIAIINKDSSKLQSISNQTVHSASMFQDAGSVTLAVLVYTVSKVIERGDYKKIPNWELFVKRFNSFMGLAILALKENKYEKYPIYLEDARKALTTISINLKQYIQEVLRKASINKASKIYEHGISMGQTAKMLGLTQWELSEYAGQKNMQENFYSKTLDVKKRVQMAVDFFS